MLAILALLAALVAPVKVSISNEAQCAVRVEVLQSGSILKTAFVESLSKREVTVKAPRTDEPLTYRVIGTACTFDRYELAPSGNGWAERIELTLASQPALSTATPR